MHLSSWTIKVFHQNLRTKNSFLFILILSFYHMAHAQTGMNVSAIDTSFLLKINQVEQYIEIKGVSRTKPVLLFIHGGPGWPATPMLRKYSQALTNDYVLVSWDQRNCGKSKTDTTSPTVSLYIEDAHQVTQFLKKQFNREKIFIIGHSWGSNVGIQLIQKYPEDYGAYIGVGQFVNAKKSEAKALEFVKAQAIANNDSGTLNVIGAISFSEEKGYENGFADIMKFRSVANKYFVSPMVAKLENPMTMYEDYSKIDWFANFMPTAKALIAHMDAIHLDLFNYTDFQVPVYFMLGRYDHDTSSEVAETYFNAIKGPKKQLIWFEKSGHSPHWEEPVRFHQELLKIVK
jgi:proline iminopeptidase